MNNFNFVPILYRRTGIVDFSALLAERRFNNLRVFNTPGRTDSIPGHHHFSLFSGDLRQFYKNRTEGAPLVDGLASKKEL